jgi:hypothetical protein
MEKQCWTAVSFLARVLGRWAWSRLIEMIVRYAEGTRRREGKIGQVGFCWRDTFCSVPPVGGSSLRSLLSL